MKVLKRTSTYNNRWLILVCFVALTVFVCAGILTYFYYNYQVPDIETNTTSGAPTNSDLWTDSSSYYSQPSGRGTSSSPYLIASAENLAWISARYSSLSGRYFRQTADIDLSAHYWNPINNNGSSYTYYYDGNGHTISGLYIDANLLSSQRYIGLFGRINGTSSSYGYVQNLGLISGAITNGQYYIASIVGNATYLNVINCYNKGVTLSGESYIGGIVGNVSNTEITNCYNSADITSTGYGSYIGGIAAFFHVSCTFSSGGYSGALEITLTKCYNLGNISASNCSYVGGIAGSLTYMVMTSGGASSQMLNMYVTYCYNKGNITGSEQVGGIAGQLSNSSSFRLNISSTYNTGSVSASYQYAGGVFGYSDYSSSSYLSSRYNYYNTTNTGVSRGLGGSGSGTTSDSSLYIYGRTLTQMTSTADGSRPSAFNSSYFPTSVWAFYEDCTPMLADVGEGINGPVRLDGTGTSSDPYIIDTAEKLAYISENYDSSDIYGHYFMQTADISLSSYSPWTPINQSSTARAYYYNGNNYSITNLTVSSTSSYSGLFGYNSGYIQNLTVSGMVSGGQYTGGIVGRSSASITDCDSSVNVSSSSSHVGGVVGYTTNTISSCASTGTVSGGNYTGGVVGYISSTISSSNHRTGQVSTSTANAYIGGVAGYSSSSITSCYNSATVSSSSYGRIGGVVGNFAGSSLSSSYNTGTVRSTYTSSGAGYIGGVAGYVASTVTKTLTSVRNTGSVSGSGTATRVGGVFGYFTGTATATVYNSGSVSGAYYTGGVAGQSAGTVSNWQNRGSVTGSGRYTGGVVGYSTGSLTSCSTTSASRVTGTGENTGGIARYCSSDVSSSYNVGIVSGTGTYVGGIIAEVIESVIILNCYNAGSLQDCSGFVGGITGDNAGTIIGCYNSGEVDASVNVGGIAGSNVGLITNSYNTAAVSGSSMVGGVVGCQTTGSITNCFNTGNIISDDQSGGIAGQNSMGTISSCYNTAVISSTSHCGGIVGLGGGSVSNVYNLGAVQCTGSYSGGIVGYLSAGDGISMPKTRISNCFNVATVTGSSYVGGVVGYIANSTLYPSQYASVSWCYYNTSTVGGAVSQAIGYGNGYQCYGLTTAQMQGLQNANYMNLSNTFWNFASGSYPTLKYVRQI